jgi:hypothetical protein
MDLQVLVAFLIRLKSLSEKLRLLSRRSNYVVGTDISICKLTLDLIIDDIVTIAQRRCGIERTNL